MEPLHRLPFPRVQHQAVSIHSIWVSKTWRFPDPTAGTPDATLHWGRPLPDGSCLLDTEWGPFLDACKRLVWSLRTERAVGKPMKVGTLNSWTVGFWFIVDWMSQAGYRDMAELDPTAIEEYLVHLKTKKIFGNDADNILSGQMILRYIMPFSHMWQQADVLHQAGVKTLPQAPFRGRPASVVAKEIAEFSEGEIASVDDDSFVATASELAVWLEFKGGDIIRLVEIALKLKAQYGVWWDRTSKRVATSLRPELRDFAFSSDPRTGAPWHPPLADCKNPSKAIRDLMTALNLAGVITLQALVGMRISEVCGLEVDQQSEGEFPSCIQVESSASGVFDIFYIKGRLFKTTSEWVETKWVAGLRPKGTAYLPPSVQAILLAERLFRPWRQAGAPNSLFMSIFSPNGMPTGVGNFRLASSSNSPSTDQNAWIVRHVGINPPIHVTSHQWRKAFAKHIFRSDKRMLPAISLHLKHISLAMTEKYVGNDIELIEDINSEASRYTSNRLYEWATGSKPAHGPTAKLIIERCASLGQRLGNYNADEKMREIERIVEENGIRIWGLKHADKPYGVCVFRPGVAFCRSAPIGPMARPDMASINPGLCSGCLSFAVDDEHSQFWKERYRQNVALLAECKASEVGVAMLARKRADQCREVLGWLGVASDETEDAA